MSLDKLHSVLFFFISVPYLSSGVHHGSNYTPSLSISPLLWIGSVEEQ